MPSRIFRILSVVSVLMAGVGRLHAQDSTTDDETRIDRLIRGLTAVAFEVRRESEQELRQVDLGALPRLRDVAMTGDLEVRRRVERIIADVERRAVTAAVERLERGEEPESSDLVYGWERFCEQLGNNTESRELFAELLRAEPVLMRAVDGPAHNIQAEFESRCADLGLWRGGRRRMTPGRATVAALLFVGGQPECRPSTLAANCINTIVQQGEFSTVLNGSNPPENLQLLLGRWIARPESAAAMQRLSIAAKFDLTEGLDIAREMIHSRVTGPQVQYAVLYLAKLGHPHDMHVLEQLLDDDETEFQVGRRAADNKFTSRMQDVALAGLLHMTGQDPREHGFEAIRDHDMYLYAPGSVGFADEETRTSALGRWRRWSAAHLREVKPEPAWAIEGTST